MDVDRFATQPDLSWTFNAQTQKNCSSLADDKDWEYVFEVAREAPPGKGSKSRVVYIHIADEKVCEMFTLFPASTHLLARP